MTTIRVSGLQEYLQKNNVDMFEFLLKTESISFSLTQMLTKQDEGKEVVGVLLQ